MALALATQRIADYHPSKSTILATMRLAAEAVCSPVLIDWRKGAQNPSKLKIDKAGARCLQQASELLRDVRSFPGDMDMMDSVAKLAKSGSLNLSKALPRNRLLTMPLCHFVDQHTYRGIGHIGPSAGTTWSGRPPTTNGPPLAPGRTRRRG